MNRKVFMEQTLHIKNLKIKKGELTSKEAKRYLCGHFGYMKYANVYNFTNKYFANELQELG